MTARCANERCDRLRAPWIFNHADSPISTGGVSQEDLVTPLRIGTEGLFGPSKNNVISLDATSDEQNLRPLIEVQNRPWSRCHDISCCDGTDTVANRAQKGWNSALAVSRPLCFAPCSARATPCPCPGQAIISSDPGRCRDQLKL